MIRREDVTAVLVTRGDVDLQPILDSLIFENVEIYDNSIEPDLATYGRVAAALRASTALIYSQDDDIIHSHANQQALLELYEPCEMTGCMWPEWSDGARRQGIKGGYDDIVFPGSGSIAHRQVWLDAIAFYLEKYPADDFFRLWSDTIIGTLAPTNAVSLRFAELAHADNHNRMAWLPNAVADKTEAIRRARLIRDAGPA